MFYKYLPMIFFYKPQSKYLLNFGKVLGLVRLAVVGKLSGADLFMTLEIIGKNSAIKRIEALVSHIK